MSNTPYSLQSILNATYDPDTSSLKVTGGSSGSGNPDNITITLNSSSKMQAVGLKETNASNTQKVWVGTLAQYNSQNKSESDDICYITDSDKEITIDSALSRTSTNPVQNKVIKEALDAKMPVPENPVTGQFVRRTANGWDTASIDVPVQDVVLAGSTESLVSGGTATIPEKWLPLTGGTVSGNVTVNNLTMGEDGSELRINSKGYNNYASVRLFANTSVPYAGCLMLGGEGVGSRLTSKDKFSIISGDVRGVGDTMYSAVIGGCLCYGNGGNGLRFNLIACENTALTLNENNSAYFGKFNADISAANSVVRVTGGGTSLENRKNIEVLDWDGNHTVSGAHRNFITVIPAATSAYTLTEGVSSHAPSAAPTYTLPAVTDSTVTHECVLYIDMTTTASIAFQDADGNAITPKCATTPAVGEMWCFRAHWSPISSQWIITGEKE